MALRESNPTTALRTTLCATSCLRRKPLRPALLNFSGDDPIAPNVSIFFLNQTKIYFGTSDGWSSGISARGSRSPKIAGKLINVKALGTWLLTLLLAVTCALPAAMAPGATTKCDAARAVFNLPLRSSRRPSRALPFEENLRSLSLQEESAPRGSLGRVFDARLRRISRFSTSSFPLATVSSFPIARLCRLRI